MLYYEIERFRTFFSSTVNAIKFINHFLKWFMNKIKWIFKFIKVCLKKKQRNRVATLKLAVNFKLRNIFSVVNCQVATWHYVHWTENVCKQCNPTRLLVSKESILLCWHEKEIISRLSMQQPVVPMLEMSPFQNFWYQFMYLDPFNCRQSRMLQLCTEWWCIYTEGNL